MIKPDQTRSRDLFCFDQNLDASLLLTVSTTIVSYRALCIARSLKALPKRLNIRRIILPAMIADMDEIIADSEDELSLLNIDITPGE